MNRDPARPGGLAGGMVLGLLALTVAGPVVAQGRSVLELLDPAGRELVLGETRVGELSAADWRSPNDSYLQAWTIALTVGRPAYIDLVSDEFDAYLYVVGPGLDDALSDDDGAGSCNSRVMIDPVVSGTFRVVVSALGARSGGAFTLRAGTEPGPETGGSCQSGRAGTDPDMLAALDPAGRRVGLDSEASGSLSEADRQPGGGVLQSWTFAGEAGMPVTFDLLSRDFDTYLYLVGPSLNVETNDDAGGACNARITTVLAETGEYRIVVSSFGDRTGSFVLRASSEEPAESEGPCPGSGPALDADSVFAMTVMGPPLGVGDTVAGELSAGDPMVDGAYAQVWEHVAVEGRPFTVDLRSDAFDAMLYVFGPEMVDYVRDDDGGGACHSRATVRPSHSGPYRILVTAIASGTGDYALSVSDRPGPPAAGACGGGGDDFPGGASVPLDELETNGRTLEFGATVTGEITGGDLYDASMFQAWEFTASGGESITVDLMSEAFDAYLYLLGPGLDSPLTDDDGGEGLNARITTRLTEGGTYRVVVSMLGQDQGLFRLRLTRNP